MNTMIKVSSLCLVVSTLVHSMYPTNPLLLWCILLSLLAILWSPGAQTKKVEDSTEDVGATVQETVEVQQSGVAKYPFDATYEEGARESKLRWPDLMEEESLPRKKYDSQELWTQKFRKVRSAPESVAPVKKISAPLAKEEEPPILLSIRKWKSRTAKSRDRSISNRRGRPSSNPQASGESNKKQDISEEGPKQGKVAQQLQSALKKQEQMAAKKHQQPTASKKLQKLAAKKPKQQEQNQNEQEEQKLQEQQQQKQEELQQQTAAKKLQQSAAKKPKQQEQIQKQQEEQKLQEQQQQKREELQQQTAAKKLQQSATKKPKQQELHQKEQEERKLQEQQQQHNHQLQQQTAVKRQLPQQKSASEMKARAKSQPNMGRNRERSRSPGKVDQSPQEARGEANGPSAMAKRLARIKAIKTKR